ncbi:M15 family metallopeptidase [Hymenobacter yonginensis]|uniref:M15 family metallopeptidase n=1 Tax=Hymenobacter yonginensis TaxID=748197 RepID=A0ABY7PPN3_9BACT|nr:M15 family metallopeptidase [Hymenobacter yonginensis]WBO84490.1 M15 family metallopeptidase [Hymenobacter yonginensis]
MSAAIPTPTRLPPALSPNQATAQAQRLAQAVPHLAASYTQALARWLGDPVLRLAGRPIITECYRTPERQNELFAQGRTRPGLIVTYKRGGESKHNLGPPTPALDVAFLLADGSVSWSGLLLSKFARLMKYADALVVWGGDWKMRDRPHFEVLLPAAPAGKGGDGRG